jgi:hypothetical protein
MRAAPAATTLDQRVSTLEKRANVLRSDLDAVSVLLDARCNTIKAMFAGIGKGL